ncbi:hypothetical protein FQA39_LY13022 [Lamprigera yunnana]|nr:hypothetical protein FQA39_LY13022 [Lamprigera yunnana]
MFIQFGTQYIGVIMGKRIEIDLRNRALERLVRQDISYYSDKKIGELLTKIISDTQIVGDQAATIPSTILNSILTITAAMALMFVFQPIMAGSIFIVFIVILLFMGVTFMFSKKLIKKVREVLTDINGDVTDRINNVRLIKSAGTEDYETKRFGEVHQEYYRALFQIVMLTMGIAQASVASARIEQTIQSTSIMDPHYTGGIEIDSIKGNINFKGVSFAYPEKPGQLIIPKFDFTFEQGKSYAFVGETGSGKSTIAKLLLRFYDPTEGSVLINENIDLKDVKLSTYLYNVGYVEQEPQILFGDVYDNVRYGRFDATNEEVIEACYDTILGERGFMLSGGQKQRLVIARMFLKDPQLLILDEATSALDNIVEKEIQAKLEDLMEGRTTVSIAHRLSTIKNADQIIVLGANGADKKLKETFMLDINYIEENKEKVIKQLNTRNSGDYSDLINEAIKLNVQRKETILKVESLKSEKNNLSKQIGILMKDKKMSEVEKIKNGITKMNTTIDSLDKDLNNINELMNDKLRYIPNLPHADITIGTSEDDNKEIKV